MNLLLPLLLRDRMHECMRFSPLLPPPLDLPSSRHKKAFSLPKSDLVIMQPGGEDKKKAKVPLRPRLRCRGERPLSRPPSFSLLSPLLFPLRFVRRRRRKKASISCQPRPGGGIRRHFQRTKNDTNCFRYFLIFVRAYKTLSNPFPFSRMDGPFSFLLRSPFCLMGGRGERERERERGFIRGQPPKKSPIPFITQQRPPLRSLAFFSGSDLSPISHIAPMHTRNEKRTPRGCRHHFSSVAIAGFQVNGIRQTF